MPQDTSAAVSGRRSLLKGLGFGAVSVAGSGVVSGTSGENSDRQGSHVISINSPSGVLIEYEFTVSGSVSPSRYVPPGLPHDEATIDPDDVVTGDTVTGATQGGVDSFQFTGRLVDFRATNCGSANVWIDGEPRNACGLPTGDGGGGQPGFRPHDVTVEGLAASRQEAFVRIAIEDAVDDEFRYDGSVRVETAPHISIQRLIQDSDLGDSLIELAGVPLPALGGALTLWEALHDVRDEIGDSPREVTIHPRAIQDVVEVVVWLRADSPVTDWDSRENVRVDYEYEDTETDVGGRDEKPFDLATCS